MVQSLASMVRNLRVRGCRDIIFLQEQGLHKDSSQHRKKAALRVCLGGWHVLQGLQFGRLGSLGF